MSRNLSYSLKVLPLVLSFLMIFGIIHLERIFLPVTSKFEFTRMHRIGYVIEIEGEYIPKRDCQWVGGRFVGYDENKNEFTIKIDKVNAYSGKYLRDGVKDIGIWSFVYDQKTQLQNMEFVAYFKCHPFWITETNVIKFRAPKTIFNADGSIDISELNKDLLTGRQIK